MNLKTSKAPKKSHESENVVPPDVIMGSGNTCRIEQ